MILLICLIVFIFSVLGSAWEADMEERRKEDYRTAERRHRELMQKRNESRRKVTTRRVVHKDDVTLGEEIVEEFYE